jgi:RNA polymerase sigma-70 factor, ECF subfamily
VTGDASQMPAEPAAVPEAHDERDLVNRARSGDLAALSAIYDRYLTRIYRYVLAHVSSQTDAEDITQDVFLRVAEAIGRFEWREVEFSSWIFRIAKNQMISHHRKGATRAGNVSTDDIDVEDAEPTPEHAVEQAMIIREVFDACADLPQSQREVIALRFGSGLSVKETADSLGKSENNVKVLQHKAIQRLQKMLGAR